MFDDLITAAGLQSGDRLLEVGCATGKATLPLAQRGFGITCVELGPTLAATARVNLAEYDVDVLNGRFEDFAGDESYTLVYAATAWHWIDPAIRYAQARRALQPGGHLAFWEAVHVVPDDGDPFFREIQSVYDEIGDGFPPGTTWPRPGELPGQRADIEASGLFSTILVQQYDWEIVYTAEEYVALLTTFSGHIAMADWQRDRLYSEIRRLLADRSVRRHWGGVLHVARRLP